MQIDNIKDMETVKMKKVKLLMLLILVITSSTNVYGRMPQDDVEPKDSTVDVIGWFNKCDTLIYRIYESSWTFNGTDTICDMQTVTRVRINVVDSTAKGYKMEYTFLEIIPDTVSKSNKAEFMNKIMGKVAPKIVGTTIKFETDECGEIKKINNMSEVKKHVKTIFKEVFNELSADQSIKELKEKGIDVVGPVKKSIDNDELIEDYMAELKMLFSMHGSRIKLGETTEHEDATENSYENESYLAASIEDNGDYVVTYGVTNIVPKNDLKALTGALFEAIGDGDAVDDFDNNYDKVVKEDLTFDEFTTIRYIVNGWPYRAVNTKSRMSGGRGKAEQTVVALEYASFEK